MNGIGVSAVTAYTAHREWASRPPDERYASVHALYDAARARRLRTEERTIETVAVRTEAVGADALALRDTSGRQAALTNWSFEQLAGIAAAPPKYLRTLPAAIASDAINYGLRRQRREQQQLLVDGFAAVVAGDDARQLDNIDKNNKLNPEIDRLQLIYAYKLKLYDDALTLADSDPDKFLKNCSAN